jgi:hypothetical protein
MQVKEKTCERLNIPLSLGMISRSSVVALDMSSPRRAVSTNHPYSTQRASHSLWKGHLLLRSLSKPSDGLRDILVLSEQNFHAACNTLVGQNVLDSHHHLAHVLDPDIVQGPVLGEGGR